MKKPEKQNSLDAFPPAWAEAWGEDEFGLFADMVFHSDIFEKLRAPEQLELEMGQSKSRFVTQRFRWIAAGDFLMGSPKSEPERSSSEDQHKVTLTQGYWLADTVVTQALWQLVVGEKPVSVKEGLKNPVQRVSWDDAQEFIISISQKFAKLFGTLTLRLPTEAEWEHACRAATKTPFFFRGNVTSDQVNFNSSRPYNRGVKSKYREQTVAVKSLPPNAWGLYEMHGNVWEWCTDVWESQLGEESIVNPYHSGVTGAHRVLRGGSWIDGGRRVRSAYRLSDSPVHRRMRTGLRLSLGPELKSRGEK